MEWWQWTALVISVLVVGVVGCATFVNDPSRPYEPMACETAAARYVKYPRMTDTYRDLVYSCPAEVVDTVYQR